MTARIFLKLILGTLAVLVVALASADILASRVAEQSHLDTLHRELSYRGQTLCALGQSSWTDQQAREAGRGASARITRIDRAGRVLFDSEAAAARMENHASRPEMAGALNGLTSAARRTSGTTGADLLYVAVPCQGGALRLAVPLESVRAQVDAIRKRMLASVAIAFVPPFFVAFFFARTVSSKLGRIIDLAGKLAEGRFQARLDEPGDDELGLLGQKLNGAAGNLQAMFEELQREHRELERQEQVRKDFVINVSHELRTPLASIQGYTETLLGGAADEPSIRSRFLRIIHQNTERLTTLASDLLTLSQIEQKVTRFECAPYYVNTLLLDCVDSMRPIAAKRGVRLHIDAAPDRSEVFADAKAVHQALGNLIDNAIKYSPEGGEIHIGAEPVAGGFIEFHVRDQGPGVPETDQPRLFERFYRVDKARSRELGGTGLGLAIVKHLVKTHGGEVGVRSEVGRGSTFWFTLPPSESPNSPDRNANVTNLRVS